MALTLAERVTQLREARGLTRYGLAQRADLSNAYVRAIEEGRSRHPSAETLVKLARGLDVPVSDLMAEVDLLPPRRDPAGLDSLPVPFRRAVRQAMRRFTTEDQWRTAASFLAWMAAVGPQPDQAYGHQTPDEDQSTDAKDDPGAG